MLVTSQDTLTFKYKKVKWILPKMVRPRDVVFSERLCQPQKVFYEVLGYRKPKAGEWYLSGAEVEAYKCLKDSDCNYLVIRLLSVATQINAYEEGEKINV